MNRNTLIAAALAGLSLVATSSTFAQDRAKNDDAARRAAAGRKAQAEKPADDDARRAQAEREKAGREANNAGNEAERRAQAEREKNTRRAEGAGGTDDERRKNAERANNDVDTKRKGLERARQVHQRNVNLRQAKLAHLRASSTEKNDAEMLKRVGRLEAKQRELDLRRRQEQQAAEAA